MGIEPKSSERANSTFNYWAISLNLQNLDCSSWSSCPSITTKCSYFKADILPLCFKQWKSIETVTVSNKENLGSINFQLTKRRLQEMECFNDLKISKQSWFLSLVSILCSLYCHHLNATGDISCPGKVTVKMKARARQYGSHLTQKEENRMIKEG